MKRPQMVTLYQMTHYLIVWRATNYRQIFTSSISFFHKVICAWKKLFQTSSRDRSGNASQ